MCSKSEVFDFDQLDPDDGFTVFLHELGQIEASIWLGWRERGHLKYGGPEESKAVEIWRADHPTAADLGRRSRARVLAEAVCRYFTAGGNWDELRALIDEMARLIPGGLVFPGYHLFDTYTDAKGHVVYVYVRTGTNEVVRWVAPTGDEAGFIDHITLEDLQREAEEGDAAGCEGDLSCSPALLGSDDLQAAEPPDDDPPRFPGPEGQRE